MLFYSIEDFFFYQALYQEHHANTMWGLYLRSYHSWFPKPFEVLLCVAVLPHRKDVLLGSCELLRGPTEQTVILCWMKTLKLNIKLCTHR